MLKVWGRVNSLNVQKVLWALAELDVSYERIDAGMQFGVVNEPFYRKMNPNSRVPTIEEDGFILWESNAIVRYLAARNGKGSLWQTDLRQRADADRWMDWASTTLQPVMHPVFWGLIRTPPEKRDLAAIEEANKALGDTFAVLEQGLEGRNYVAGANFSMGDIPVGAYAWRWYSLPVVRPNLKNVEAWYARLKERHAYRTYVMLPLS